jgi:hypothetical protein
MNPFLLSPRDRLSDWKQFRSSLASMSEPDQLAAVARYWAQAPEMSYACDPEAPETWPTPWEMISDGGWCRHSRAIGMEFTLRLAGWHADRLRLALINDKDRSDVFFVLVVDEAYYLNYDHGEVVPVPETMRICISTTRFTGKHYTTD